MAKAGGKKKGTCKPAAASTPNSPHAICLPGRKPSGPPEQVRRDAAAIRLLADTLKRAKPPFAPSLRSQIIYLVRQALKWRRVGRDVFSESMANIAAASGCKKRQAQMNMRALENWEAFILLAEGGGAANPTWRLDGEMLHRVLVTRACNPHPDLRAALRTPETIHRPMQSTHAVTHAVAQGATHAVHGVFSKQNHCLVGNDSPSDTATGPTHAVEGGFNHANQIVRRNENAISPIYDSLARAELSFCPDAAGGGDVQPRDEPIVGETGNRPEPSPFTEKRSHSQAERSREEKNSRSSVVPYAMRHACPTVLTFAVLRHLRAKGPVSYGAIASDLGISIGAAWRTDDMLTKIRAITHDKIGRMVPLAGTLACVQIGSRTGFTSAR